MRETLASLAQIVFRRVGEVCLGVADRLLRKANASELVASGAGRNLYRTRFGDFFWLDPQRYLDQYIIRDGVFEPASTDVVSRLVKPGDTVLDVGANIGYYSVLLSRMVGDKGKVLSFEPTEHYSEILARNLAQNRCSNVWTYRLGLSSKEEELDIYIGECSASLYSFDNQVPRLEERIQLQRLDHFAQNTPLERLDFIKIDVDGHEPLFLEGAWQTIDRFNPAILLEVSHQHYLKAGCAPRDFFQRVRGKGFRVYDENGMAEIQDADDFLRRCGNFAYSSNVVLSRRALV